MSILGSASPANAMTESPGHVLGQGFILSDWFFSGFFDAYPFEEAEGGQNYYSFDGTGTYAPGTGFFDGTWMLLYFFDEPTQIGPHSWLSNPPYDPLDNQQTLGVGKNNPPIIYTFGTAWQKKTAADVNLPGWTTGTWFVAPMNSPDNSYTMRWKQSAKPGKYAIDASISMRQDTVVIASFYSGSAYAPPINLPAITKTNTDVQPAQPTLQLVSVDGTQTFAVQPTAINQYLDTAKLFGRSTLFYPQITFPPQTQPLADPVAKYGPGTYQTYPGGSGTNVYFEGVRVSA